MSEPNGKNPAENPVPRVVYPRHGGAGVVPGNPGNSGGKRGRSGARPSVVRAASLYGYQLCIPRLKRIAPA